MDPDYHTSSHKSDSGSATIDNTILYYLCSTSAPPMDNIVIVTYHAPPFHNNVYVISHISLESLFLQSVPELLRGVRVCRYISRRSSLRTTEVRVIRQFGHKNI